MFIEGNDNHTSAVAVGGTFKRRRQGNANFEDDGTRLDGCPNSATKLLDIPNKY